MIKFKPYVRSLFRPNQMRTQNLKQRTSSKYKPIKYL